MFQDPNAGLAVLLALYFTVRAIQHTPGDGNQLWYHVDTKSILFESVLDKLSTIGFTHKGSICGRSKRQHSRAIGDH